MGGLVGRLVAVGKDTGWESVGVARTGDGAGRATMTVGVKSAIGLGVGRGVDDGSGDDVTVAGISCRVDDGSGNGVVVTATASKGLVGNGVVAGCAVWAHAANAIKPQNIKIPGAFLCFTFSPVLPAIARIQNIAFTFIGANHYTMLEILHCAIETSLSLIGGVT